jgi:hypothetical protein
MSDPQPLPECPLVVCDANVLYSIVLTDLLLSLGVTELLRPRWTTQIHEEWMRNLLADRPELDPAKIERRRDQMDAALDDCLITGYEALIPTLQLPDADDRHVLAAAIHAQADVLLTSNLRVVFSLSSEIAVIKQLGGCEVALITSGQQICIDQ